jgi:hypothetical protein
VPANGLIVTSPTRTYQFGPITGNNSLQLTASNATGALTLATPANYAGLSILLADGYGLQPNAGGALGSLLVNWSNGSSTAANYVVYDWYEINGQVTSPSGVAANFMFRVFRPFGGTEQSALGPNLYFYDLDLSNDPNHMAGALVDGITFTSPGYIQPGGPIETTNIMGLSGTFSVPEPSSLALLAAAGCFAVWRRRQRGGYEQLLNGVPCAGQYSGANVPARPS